MKLVDLRDINEVHSDMLLHLKVDELDPLLVEIFELPPSSEIDSMHCAGGSDKKSKPPAEGEKAEADISSACDLDSSKGKLPPSTCVAKFGYPQKSSPDQPVRPDSSLKEQPTEPERDRVYQSEQICSISTSASSPTLVSQGQGSPPLKIQLHQQQQHVMERQRPYWRNSSLSPTSASSPTLQQPVTNETPWGKCLPSPPSLSRLRLNSLSGSTFNKHTPPSSVNGLSSLKRKAEEISPCFDSYPCHGPASHMASEALCGFRNSQKMQF